MPQGTNYNVFSSFPAAPAATDIVSGTLTNSTGVIIGIPPNRTWIGCLSLSGTNFQATGAGAVNYHWEITTVGGTVTPAAGTVLALNITSPALSTSTNSNGWSGSNSVSAAMLVVAVGSSSASLSLQNTGANTNYSASANGYLIA